MGIKANKIHSLSLELPFSNRLLFYWSTEQVLHFFDMTNDLPPSTAIAINMEPEVVFMNLAMNL